MKKIVFLLLPAFLMSSATFITPLEYAAQLYKNPRGIGCQYCHGEHGEGKIIARYKHKSVQKSFVGPAIKSVAFREFFQALNRKKNGMPRYFLTQKEIEALYLYLHQDDNNEQYNDE